MSLARREQSEDHHERMRLDRATHQLGDDYVALDLVDEQEEERHGNHGFARPGGRERQRASAPSHGPTYGMISTAAAQAPNPSA